MEYIHIKRFCDLEDEPEDTYYELDEGRHEVRRVEFFRGGPCFSYGAELGNQNLLPDTPFPKDLYQFNQVGIMEARTISSALFQEIWQQAKQCPDGFMGLFF